MGISKGSFVFHVMILIAFLKETGSQGTGLLQKMLESTKTNGDVLFNPDDLYLKKLIPVITEEHENSEKENSENNSLNESTTPKLVSMKGVPAPLPNLPFIGFTHDNESGPSGILSATTKDYFKELMKPAQESGAEIVEGAVKTGVDQAISSISENFKYDIVLVVAVFVIQVVLFICGAHLYFYVYQREREMRRYVEQQISVVKNTRLISGT